MPNFITCPICGATFNPAYLDQVAEHMHEGLVIDETIKGQRAPDGWQDLPISDVINKRYWGTDGEKPVN